MFDIMVKRLHEYKRQLMNILETIALYNAMRAHPGTAWVPRGYLMGPEMADIADKLRAHNIKVTVLDKAMRAEGDEFVISGLKKTRSAGYDMTTLEGAFATVAAREFPAGSFSVDMAQPMANAHAYYRANELQKARELLVFHTKDRAGHVDWLVAGLNWLDRRSSKHRRNITTTTTTTAHP